jgi:hypothetical protein
MTMCVKGEYIQFKNLDESWNVADGDIALILKGGKGTWKVRVMTGKRATGDSTRNWGTHNPWHYEKIPKKLAEKLIIVKQL